LNKPSKNRPQLSCQNNYTQGNRRRQQFQEASCIDIRYNAEKPDSSLRNHALPQLHPQSTKHKSVSFCPSKTTKEKKLYLGQALLTLKAMALKTSRLAMDDRKKNALIALW
jgi:hypothetical protein